MRKLKESRSLRTQASILSSLQRTISLYPFQFKIQFYALPFASYIQRKLNLRVTSRIRRTRPPLRHYVITITSSRRPGSSALPRPSSYTAAPRRTAPGPSNLCPSYLTTFITIHSSYGCLVKKKILNSILRLAGCILHPTETQSPSHIQNTKDTPTITSLQLRHM